MPWALLLTPCPCCHPVLHWQCWCWWLLVLVSLLLLAPPLPLFAHHHHGDGDRPISTQSTLQARAGSGRGQVLGCHLIHLVFMCMALYLSCTHNPPHEKLLMMLGWVVQLLHCPQLVALAIHLTSSCSKGWKQVLGQYFMLRVCIIYQ